MNKAIEAQQMDVCAGGNCIVALWHKDGGDVSLYSNQHTGQDLSKHGAYTMTAEEWLAYVGGSAAGASVEHALSDGLSTGCFTVNEVTRFRTCVAGGCFNDLKWIEGGLVADEAAVESITDRLGGIALVAA